jgi:hypothetical protein
MVSQEIAHQRIELVQSIRTLGTKFFVLTIDKSALAGFAHDQSHKGPLLSKAQEPKNFSPFF